MSAPVVTTAAVVVGDGTTTRGRATSRWRRWRLPLVVVGGVLVVAALAALPEPRTSTVALAPDNPGPTGARAVAQILGRQGVDVHYVRTSADARRLAHPGTTLLVTSDYLLSDDQVTALHDTGADLALVNSSWALEQLTSGAASSTSTGFDVTTRSAACADPDAVAAGTITVGGGIVVTGAPAASCFPSPDDPDAAGYVVLDGRQRVATLSDGTPLENAHLADQGNAALALRMLGRHPDLVWYVPSAADQGASDGSSQPTLRDLLPREVGLVALATVLVLVVLAVWRGRRLGRLVAEPLPVVVPGGETTRGRGRLYRRARAHGHAAAALRAGTATRCAERLGLPRSADRTALVPAVAHASGRDPHAVDDLLYGPPPTDDRALTRLARDLDDLESEVQRP